MAPPTVMPETSQPNRRVAPLGGDLQLLMTALIWGSGFVAQRAASTHVGPLTFNAVRNAISVLALLPLVLRWGRRPPAGGFGWLPGIGAGSLAGAALFAGGWLQQAGIASTTAGNAGFITGLYVIFVPLLAALGGARLPASTWPAAGLATAGLYLLSVTGDWRIGRGDALVLASAGFWSLHVLLVGWLAPRLNPFWLAWLQVATATVLSVPLAGALEPISWAAIQAAAWPMLYAGILCGAVAFTFQILGQRQAPPAHAAILMSLEAVFAAVFGWLLLDERLGARGMTGAGLMLAGMLVSQWPQLRRGVV